MDIVRVQVLANEAEQEKKDTLVKKLNSIGYLRVEKPLEEGVDWVESMKDDRSHVVLVFEHFDGNGYVSSQQITERFPSKSIILIKSDRSQANIREIVRSGAADIVPFDVDIQRLTDLIYSTYQTSIKKQEAIKSERDQRLAQEGRVFTVFSAKGGTGKTFIATNLATKLAQDKESRVVLVDLDVDYGGVAMAFNIDADTTIDDAVDDTLHLDSDLMESYLIEHESGVHILAGRSQPNEANPIAWEQVEIIIKMLKQSFDYIIVDMPNRFAETVGPAFNYAHAVLLVTTPEVLALKNARSALNVFEGEGFPMDHVLVILNKVAFGGISRRDVETTLEYDIYAEIPEDIRRVRKSQNEGRPYVSQFRKGAVTKAIDKIVEGYQFK